MEKSILIGNGSFGFCISPPIYDDLLELKEYENKEENDVSKIFKYNNIFGEHENNQRCWITKYYDDDDENKSE